MERKERTKDSTGLDPFFFIMVAWLLHNFLLKTKKKEGSFFPSLQPLVF
jgi:hypothetical protein